MHKNRVFVKFKIKLGFLSTIQKFVFFFFTAGFSKAVWAKLKLAEICPD